MADAIARAVLYEGYMLYPYRPSSVKNRQRFNFGVLYPRAYSEAQNGSDTWSMQTECLVKGTTDTRLEIRVRFLQLIARSIARLNDPKESPYEAPGPHFMAFQELDSHVTREWQEAEECVASLPPFAVSSAVGRPLEQPFEFASQESSEPQRNDAGDVVAVALRKRKTLRGMIEVRASEVERGLFKIRVVVSNLTLLASDRADPAEVSRDSALMSSLVSAHSIFGVSAGEFISLLETPDFARRAASSCQNIGTWPVLVGEHGQLDTVLSSPIILYDYPQIASESPGDLFDGTEIDEILALRIMTLTESEKREMRDADDRARKILERTETLSPEQWLKLHGTVRELRTLQEETP